MSRALPATWHHRRAMIVGGNDESEPAEISCRPPPVFRILLFVRRPFFMTHHFPLVTFHSSIFKNAMPHVPGPMCAPDVSDRG